MNGVLHGLREAAGALAEESVIAPPFYVYRSWLYIES